MPTAHPSQKRYTCQVPLALAARLEALFEMHSQTERNQVMVDLLALGLAQVARTRSELTAAGPEPQPDPQRSIYLLTGPFEAFHGLVQKHHLALERARDDHDTLPLIEPDYRLNPDE
jgi:hypothetical protein